MVLSIADAGVDDPKGNKPVICKKVIKRKYASLTGDLTSAPWGTRCGVFSNNSD